LAHSTPVRRSKPVHGSQSVESVVDTIRSLWKAVEEGAALDQQQELKRDITETVSRLKWRVERRLRSSKSAFRERLLFERDDEVEVEAPITAEEIAYEM
jgi:hypothetical protein